MSTHLAWVSVFISALVASVVIRLWLTSRHIRHVALHRDNVPAPFGASLSLQAHHKAADYTLAKAQLDLLDTALSAAVLLGWTVLGGLDLLNQALLAALGPGMAQQMALCVAFLLVGGLLSLPLSLYQTFNVEARFGFNNMTLRLWCADLLKGLLVGAALGLPLLWAVLWLMGAMGTWWWLAAWLLLTVYQLLVMWIAPNWIMPLFNKFTPLADEELRQQATQLMERAGFTASGFFVIDGSRRSAHSNAFFTGIGRHKRVVFFDTLLTQLSHAQMQAVLAHELGHFHHRHILKRMAVSFALSLLSLALLGWLTRQVWFYTGLGVQPDLMASNDALALLLFMLTMPVFTFFIEPVLSQLSRRHEFQADAYAARLTNGRDLADALLKLHQDNATTLTPDPLYAKFHYSHPPAAQRIAQLTI